VTPDGKTLYVTDRGSDTVFVLDACLGTIQGSVSVGDDPWGIALTPDASTLLVACEDSSELYFVDTATQATSSIVLAADADPRDVEISVDGTTAYVPTGSIAGNDGMYSVAIAAKSSSFVDLGTAANSNVVAASPPLKCTP
jgi:YVTN family beta-propeller protein